MKPLAVHDPAAEALCWGLIGAWLLGETVWSVRTTVVSEGRRDPSFALMTVAFVGAFIAAIRLAASDAAALPGPGWWPVILGAAILIGGVAFRVLAVRELGRFFTYAVLVHEGQTVIDTGPYRRIRHPSYTGLLVGMLGVGIMLGTWLTIPAALAPPLVAFTWRLLTEERFLAEELGEPYRAYMERTKRLFPHVW